MEDGNTALLYTGPFSNEPQALKKIIIEILRYINNNSGNQECFAYREKTQGEYDSEFLIGGRENKLILDISSG